MAHPSGPNIHKGKCGSGMIWDHEANAGRGKCISLMAYKKKYGPKKPASQKRDKV